MTPNSASSPSRRRSTMTPWLPGVRRSSATPLSSRHAGYVSAWLARRGARPVGIDNSAVQLATARRFQDEFDLHFPLIQGDAEHTPFPDASFDFVVSEYGAAIWCDPYLWIPEAARLLRPGGQLAFLVNSALAILCASGAPREPTGEGLLRPHFGMHRFEWPADDPVRLHLPHGEWNRPLRA